MKKNICVVTGTRAEYGLLRPLISRIKEDGQVNLQLVVTGMHLSPEFGLTYKEIEEDGFFIDEKVEMLLSSDTEVAINKSIGLGMIGFADIYEKIKPDIVVVLGDRYEIFAAATAAMVSRIPIAHIHGGELGLGTIDNAFRHAITKMSDLHYTSTEEYRRRVIQLGENPKKIFNVGALGVENIRKIKLYKKTEIEEILNFKIDSRTIMLTYHPISLNPEIVAFEFNEILGALDLIKDIRIIFTKANADTGGRVINSMIDEYVEKNKKNSVSFFSLGVLKYLSVAKNVHLVMGNSSSGIIEVPSLETYTLNLGDRQSGRISSETVINSRIIRDDIVCSLEEIFKRDKPKNICNPYEKADTSLNIYKSLIENMDVNIDKRFYDIDN